MNRTEFHAMLDAVCADIAEQAGNLQDEFDTQRRREDIRLLAAVALMACDRYYSELTKQQAQRRENDPMAREVEY